MTDTAVTRSTVTDPAATQHRWLTEAEERAWRAFLSVHARLAARLNRQLQADSDLSLSDFEVLVHLTDVPDGRVRAFELGRALQWEKSRLSHHIARMERRGLVGREGCHDDRRGAFVVLTAEGRRAIEAAAPRHVDTVSELVFDALTDEQVAAMATISEQVLGRLDQSER